MSKQDFLHETDLFVTVEAVNYDEIMSRRPKKITKAYLKAVALQLNFVDYTINLSRRNAISKVKESGELVEEIDILFPLIFPENAEILPEALERIRAMNLNLTMKCVNGERSTYIISGKVSLKE